MKQSKITILLILSIAQLFGLSLWFAPNAVIDQLQPKFDLSNKDLSNLSIVVTLGFVFGGLFFSIFNIPDLISANKLFFINSLLGGLANIIIVVFNGPNFETILVLRFLTGFSLAGIYPIGMKLTASHFDHNRGFAIGILLGALTVGSGLPYLFRLFGTPDWKALILTTSILAILGGVFVLSFVSEGPFVSKSQKFNLAAVKTIFSTRSIRLANYGYLGHMFELYAFWIWFPIMLKDSFENTFPDATNREVVVFFSGGTFLIFFSGAIGNILGGFISDKIGRTKFNIIMLFVSGLSGLIVGLFYSTPYLVLTIGIIWGFTIVPDSPQYSTMITELVDNKLIGTALTIQTALGFALTIVSIKLVPIFVDEFTWKYAFMFLAIGPALGILSMFNLRNESDAIKIANGMK